MSLNIGRKARGGPDLQSFLRGMREALLIDKDALDEAVIQHPVLYDQISERYALTVSLRDAAKTESERLWAKLLLKTREKMVRAGDKPTESMVAATAAEDKEYQRSEDELSELNHMVAQCFNLQESFRQRGYMLRELCGLFASGYWASTSMKGGSVQDRIASRNRSSLKRFGPSSN